MDLTVGKLPDDLEKSASAAIKSLGIVSSDAWRHCGTDLATISLFKLSSVVLFLRHVAKLESLDNTIDPVDQTRFRQLPWWEQSIWLPIPFDRPLNPEMQSDLWPTFLGSSQRLLADLAEVRTLSDAELGVTPPHYELMRRDDPQFWQTDLQLTEYNVIQWVWKGLSDAAELSVRESAPILAL